MNHQNVLDQIFSVFDNAGITFAREELGLQMLAWVKLSALDRLPSELKAPNRSVFSSSKQLVESMSRALKWASDHAEDSSRTQLFYGTDSRYKTIPLSNLKHLLETAQAVQQRQLLDSLRIPTHVYQSLSDAEDSSFLPDEVISLMTELVLGGDTTKSQTIYCPYDNYARFSRSIALSGGLPYLESNIPSSIPWLTSILSDLDFSISFGEFLTQPAFSQGLYKNKFGTAIASVPPGKTSRAVVKPKSRLDMSPIETTSMAVLAVLDIMEQTANKAVIAVPNNVLFGTGAARSLRQHLVEKGVVASVISMHPALLFKTSLQFSILVLDFTKRHEHIQFVDGGADDFIEKDGLNRAYLKNWAKLSQAIQTDTHPSAIQKVAIKQVANNDYPLEASWYIPSSKRNRAYAIINSSVNTYAQSQLYKCADIFRSSPRLYKEGEIEAFEVVTSKFPDYGYLSNPGKSVYVNAQALDKKEHELFVHPNDILISIKGTTGKVAIAPTNIPPPGAGGWLANQSCLILRADPEEVDPIILFMYLKSDIGQILLKQIVSGAKTPLIQLKPLKNLTVLIPDKASHSHQKTIEIFAQQVSLQEQIQQLKSRQSQLSKDCWSLHS